MPAKGPDGVPCNGYDPLPVRSIVGLFCVSAQPLRIWFTTEPAGPQILNVTGWAGAAQKL